MNKALIFRAIQTFHNVNNNEFTLKERKAHPYKNLSITLKHMMFVQYPVTDSFSSLLQQETKLFTWYFIRQVLNILVPNEEMTSRGIYSITTLHSKLLCDTLAFLQDLIRHDQLKKLYFIIKLIITTTRE